MKTPLLYLLGTPYENGKQSGIYFKQPIQNEIKKYENLIQDKAVWDKCELVLNKLTDLYPEYVKEVRGKAAGAEVDFKAFWAMMCPEIVNIHLEHCTDIVCRDANGKFLLSHNEDDNFTKDNFCLAKVYNGDNWLVTNDTYDMPFGNGFGWNNHGLVKTINYCSEPEINVDNIPRYFLQRHISDAKNIEDLVKRCNDFHPASGFHVNAIDRNTNKAVSIEVYPDYVDMIVINDSYIHSNHYIHERYADNPVLDKGSNGMFRLQKATELFNELGDKNVESLKQILRYRDELDRFEYSIHQTEKDPHVTGMNFSYSVADRDKIYLDVFPYDESLILNYDL